MTASPPSKIIDFYRGGVGPRDLTLNQILDQSDYHWEASHDIIQWIFPLADPSNFNPNAPILTEEDIEEFKASQDLQEKMNESFHRFLQFLGLKYDGEKVKEGPFFNDKKPIFRLPNHNWLRITRVLLCLKLCGLEKEALAFYKHLLDLFQQNIGISENTLKYWKDAVSS